MLIHARGNARSAPEFTSSGSPSAANHNSTFATPKDFEVVSLLSGQHRLAVVLQPARLGLHVAGHIGLEQNVERRTLQARASVFGFHARLRRIGRDVASTAFAPRRALLPTHVVDANQIGRFGGLRPHLNAILSGLPGQLIAAAALLSVRFAGGSPLAFHVHGIAARLHRGAQRVGAAPPEIFPVPFGWATTEGTTTVAAKALTRATRQGTRMANPPPITVRWLVSR